MEITLNFDEFEFPSINWQEAVREEGGLIAIEGLTRRINHVFPKNAKTKFKINLQPGAKVELKVWQPDGE